MSAPASEFSQVLAALAACLDEELAALIGSDAPALAAASQRKGDLLSRLCEMPELRAVPQGGAGKRRGSPLARAMRHLKRLNARNAIALAAPMQFNAARLRFLNSAMGRSGLYAADGSIGQASGFAAAYCQPR